MGSNRFRGQSSTEFLLLFAAAVAVFAILYAVTIGRGDAFNSSNLELSANNVVNDLANAAREVHAQGSGARKIVTINMPRSYDPGNSRISQNAIILRAKNTDYVRTFSFTLQGSMPESTGTYYWVVENDGTSIVIGDKFGRVNRTAISAVVIPGWDYSDSILVSSSSYSTLNGTVSLEWPDTAQVSVVYNSSNFSIVPYGSYEIPIQAFMDYTALGSYYGKLAITLRGPKGDQAFAIPITLTASKDKFNAVRFVPPTPDDGAQASGTITINATLATTQLTQQRFLWRGNYTYSYDDSLVLAYNFDDVKSIGDTASKAKDISLFGNDGTIYGNTALLLHMDETSGLKAVDESLNGNNATCYNMGGYTGASRCNWVNGKSGKGIAFDGVNDYVDAGNSSSLLTLTYPLTLEAWVNPNTLSQNGIILNLDVYDENSELAFGIYNSKILVGRVTYRYGLASVSPYLSAGKWQHWTVVFLNPTNITFYLDGVAQLLTDVTDYYSVDSSKVLIGSRGGSTNRPFNGTIDEVAIFNRSLSAAEVLSRYNSGRAHHAEWDADGKWGSAFSFSSASTVVDAGDVSALNFGAQSFTLEGWVKAQNVTSWSLGAIMGKTTTPETSGSPKGYGLYIRSDAHKLLFKTGDGSGTFGQAPSSRVIDDNTWHHVAGVYDTETNTISAYVDGTLDGSNSLVPLDLSSTAHFKVGGTYVGEYFNGSIDEVRIWNRTISPQEIKQHYYSNLAKYSPATWVFSATERGLSSGAYDYRVFVRDNSDQENSTELRTVVVNNSLITIVPPTPADGYLTTTAASLLFPPVVNASIRNVSNLSSMVFGWGGANYSFYDPSLVLAYNLDNVEALGEGNSTKDVSQYGNNGAVYGNTKLLLHFDENGTSGTAYDESAYKNNGAVYGNTRLLLHMDEGTGNYANDSTAYGNNGTLSGATWVSGKSGTGLAFDGVDDYAEATSVGTLSGDLTLYAWVKPSAVQSYNARILDLARVANYGLEPCITISGGQLFVNDGYGPSSNIYGPAIGDNNWHFITVVRQGSNYSLYSDGTYQNSSNGTVPVYTNLQIGRMYNNNYNFNGSIDEVAVYSKALNATEIADHYNAGRAKHVDWVVGKSGTALQFDGVDDYAKTSILLNSNLSYTLSGWAKVSSTALQQSFLGVNANLATNRAYIGLRSGNYWMGIGNTQKYSVSASAIANATWFHWALSFSMGSAYYYINGVQVDSTTYVGQGGQNASPYIGALYADDSGSATSRLNGSIDEVAVYSKALNATEVLAQYNAGKAKHVDWTAAGKVNGAMEFDGSDDYIKVTNSASLSSPGNTLTIGAWIKPTTIAPGEQTILRKGSSYLLRLKGANLSTNVRISASWRLSTDAPNVISPSVWSHVATVYNGTNVLYYVNGVDVTPSSIPLTGTIEPDPSGSYIISQSGLVFNGLIDEVRVWNRSLSAAEVAQQYYGSLNKYDLDKWIFTSTPQNYSGTYTYFASVTTNESVTEATPTQAVSVVFNRIGFIPPTPANGEATSNATITINASIYNVSLDSMSFNWNGTNTSFLDNSLVLAYNFDDVAEIGDTAGKVVDVSRAGNNGTVYGNTLVLLHMDENTGSVAYDESRLGNNGTCYYGGVIANCNWTVGKSGSALSFDGNKTYVTAGSSSIYNFSSNPFAVSAWFKTSDASINGGSYRTILAFGGYVTGGWKISVKSANGYLETWWGGSAQTTGSTSVNDGNWHNVVYTRSGNSFILYLDGVQTGSSTNANSLNYTGVYLGVGGSANVLTDGYWNGSIDEVMIVNRSLSAPEVLAQYIAGRAKHADWTPDGKWGSAMKFDGLRTYVDAGAGSGPNIAAGSAHTLSAWVYPNQLGTTGYILVKGTSGVAFNYLLQLGSTGYLGYGNNTNTLASAQASLVPGVWQQVVVSSNGAAVTFYVNGVQKDTIAAANTGSTAETLKIGSRGTAAYIFNGSIDEVRVWNRSLSAAEIQQHYYSSLNKYAADKWLFSSTLGDLSTGNYSYYGYVHSADGASNFSETRSVNILGDMAVFNPPTPVNGSVILGTQVQLNATIANLSLRNMKLSFGSSNYSFLEDSLVLAYNFDDASSVGDTAGKVTDYSKYGNNGTVYGNTVGLWHFDENTANKAYDESVFGNNCTCYYNGSASNCNWTTGTSGAGLYFDGSMGTSVNCGNPVSLQNAATGSFTLSSWIYPLRIPGTGAASVIIQKDSTSWQNFRLYSGVLNLEMNVGGNYYSYSSSSGLFVPGRWYHVVAAFDNASRTVTFYVNGAADLTRNVAAGALSGALNNVYIGSYQGTSSTFNGTIDEVMVANRSLSASDVLAQYNAGRAKHANWNSNGVWGSAMNFDGADDYIDAGNASTLNTYDRLTVSAWFRHTADMTSYNNIVNRDRWSVQFKSGLHSQIGFEIANPGWNRISGPSNTNDGLWHQVVGVYDKDAGVNNFQIYFDGVLYNQTTSNGSISTTANHVTVGAYASPIAYFFNGSIDEVRVWNRSLSAQEIKQQYYGSLNKYDSNKWLFQSNVSNVDNGDYPTYVFVQDVSGSVGKTDTRTFTFANRVSFVPPTPFDGASSNTATVAAAPPLFNATVQNLALSSMNFSWNGTNYSFYDDSLVLAYNFDNVASLGESSVRAVDASKYGNDGILNGTAWTADGKYGGAMSFDGVDDYVDCGTKSLGLTDVTLGMWVKTSFIEDQYVFDGWGQGPRVQFTIDVGSEDKANMYSTVSATRVSSTTSVDDGNWHHIVYQYSGTTMRIYVDGVSEASGNGGVINWNDWVWRVGQQSALYFNGSIDEVRVWNRSLSADEVKQQYYGSLNKYDSDKWVFSYSPANLPAGSHNYSAAVVDALGVANTTGVRSYSVSYNKIGFVPATPEDGAYLEFSQAVANPVVVNASIIDLAQPGSIVLNWNGTNTSLYDSSLVLAYNFDNVATLGENATKVVDISMYGNNGTVTDAIATSDGRLGGAFVFNGVNSVIDAGNSTSLNMINSFSIEMWIKRRALSTSFVELLRRDSSDTYSLYTFTNSESVAVRFKDNVSVHHVGTGTAVPTGVWNHLVGTYDGQYLRVYLNGLLAVENSIGSYTLGTPSNNLIIGRDDAIAGRYFNGTIDEVRVYSRALSGSEVAQHYYSNVRKYAPDRWLFQSTRPVNQTGNYTYYALVTNSSGAASTTGARTLTVGNTNWVSFIPQTPANGAAIASKSVAINASVAGMSNPLSEFKLNWNGTNYSFYDADLVLAANFDNTSVSGDNLSNVQDVSRYVGSGVVYGTAQYNSSAKYGLAMDFKGTGTDMVSFANTNGRLNPVNNRFSVELWINPRNNVNVSSVNCHGVSVFATDGGNSGCTYNKSGIGYLSNGAILVSAPSFNIHYYYLTQLSTSFVPMGTWSHVAWVYDNGSSKIFVNGRLDNWKNVTLAIPQFGSVQVGKGENYGYTAFNGSIDEVRLWNRSLTDSEIQQHYYGSLNKYASDKWLFTSNEAGLTDGAYSFSASAKDSFGAINFTETRQLSVSYNWISFIPPTPSDGSATFNSTVGLSANVTDVNLSALVFNWDGANTTLYNDSLVLAYNFDSVSAIGDSSSKVVDVSKYGNNGTIVGTVIDDFEDGDYAGWVLGCSSAPTATVVPGYYSNYALKITSSNGCAYKSSVSVTTGEVISFAYKSSNPQLSNPNPNFEVSGVANTAPTCVTDGDWQLCKTTITKTGVAGLYFYSASNIPYTFDFITKGAIPIAGTYGGAMSFDGVDDYVEVPAGASSLAITGAITLSAWVKFNVALSSQSYGNIMGRGVAWSSGNNGYSLTRYGGINNVYFDTHNTTTRDTLGAPVGDTNWHFVAATWDGTTNVNGKKIYLDGVLYDQKTSTISSMGQPNYPFRIGKDGNHNYPLNGSVDEARVWARALSAAEIQQQYYSNLAKYAPDKWVFSSTQPNLAEGVHSYYLYAQDSSQSYEASANRTVEVGNIVKFVPSTPAIDAKSSIGFLAAAPALVNVTVSSANLSQFKLSWNGTTYTPYDSSLVLMYNFDNVASLGENSVKAVDVSQYGNNGTISGASWTANGKYGGAMAFDGVNDFVNVSALSQKTSSTISGWFKFNEWDNDVLFSSRRVPTSSGSMQVYEESNSKLRVLVYGTSSWQVDITSVAAFSTGTWYNLVVTGDSVAGWKLYVNGVFDNSDADVTPVFDGSTPLYLGSLGGYSPAYYFSGSIDEVRVYNRALSADEIRQQYYSNFNRYSPDRWLFQYSPPVPVGTHTYYAYASDLSGNSSYTDIRTLTVDNNAVAFVPSTPADGAFSNNTSVSINASIADIPVDWIRFNWNNNPSNSSGANYSVYDDSLLAAYNFDNSNATGDTAAKAVDISKYANNATLYGNTIVLLHLDENTGSVAYDESGYRNNGTCVYSSGTKACTWTSGKSGTGVYLNGTLKDYVNLSRSASVKGLSAASAELWYYSAALPAGSSTGALYYEPTGASGYTRFGVYHISNGSIWAGMRDTENSAAFGCYSANLSLGAWHHVATAFNAGSDVLALYVDGALICSNTASKGSFTNTAPATDMTLGLQVPYVNGINGTIDEFALYNKTLSASEILAHYNTGRASHADYTTAGKYTGALNFDGVDDYAQSASTFSIGTGQATFSAWVKGEPMQANSEQGILSLYNSGKPWFFSLERSTYPGCGSSGCLSMHVGYPDQSPYVLQGGIWPSSDAGWHFVAMTRNATAMKLFLDSMQVISSSDSSFTNFDAGSKYLRIGAPSQSYFNGTIDEVRVWNRSLSDAEITQQYYGNINKYAPGRFLFSSLQQDLPTGSYSYSLFARNAASNITNSTETRTVSVLANAYIGFTYPTINNGTYALSDIAPLSPLVNVSVSNISLRNFNFNWNGTNTTFYNDSLVLAYNFDSVKALGESSSIVKDISAYGNNGVMASGASPTVVDDFERHSTTGWVEGCAGMTSLGIVKGYYSDYAMQVRTAGGDGYACAIKSIASTSGASLSYACKGDLCQVCLWNGSVCANSNTVCDYGRGKADADWRTCSTNATQTGTLQLRAYAAYYDGSAYNNTPGAVSAYDSFTFGPIPTAGKYGGALQFDGVDDYISIADSDNWNFGSNDFAIEFWVNQRSSTVNQRYLSQFDSNSLYWQVMYNNDNKVGFNAFSPLFDVSASSAGMTLNQWHQLAFVRAAGFLYIYLNGVQIGSGAVSGSLPNPVSPVRIGKFDYDGGCCLLNGTLDELRIWNRSLSAAEIQQHYYSNLNKYAPDKWLFQSVRTVEAGYNTYYAYADNGSGLSASTETRVLELTATPRISFIASTPAQASTIFTSAIGINASIVNVSGLSEFKFDWNGTNYTMYDDSLLLAMNFDNVASIGENATRAVDVSKYGNNGTISGASWTASGKYGGAMGFDGVNDYVSAAHSSSLEPVMLTVSAWFKPTGHWSTTTDDRDWLVNKNSNEWADGFYSIGLSPSYAASDASALYAYMNIGGGSANYFGLSSSASPLRVSTNNWYFGVLTYDGLDMTIYLNGELAGSRRINRTRTFGTGALVIGGRVDGYTYFNGAIDEVRIWNRALTADEIAQQYYSNLAKYAPDKWLFQSVQRGFADGSYSFNAYAKDLAGNGLPLDERNFAVNTIRLVSPSPANNSMQFDNNVTINATIADFSPRIVKFYWNETPTAFYDDSLVLAYNFDNVSAIGDNATRVVDVSKYGRNGTISGANWTPSGKWSGAMSFDGVDDSVSTPSFTLSSSDNTMTYSFWLKNYPTSASYQNIFTDRAQGSSSGFIWIYRRNADTLRAEYANGTAYVQPAAVNFFTGYDGVWIKADVVYDYSNKWIKFYRNGELFYWYTTTSPMLFPTANRIKYVGGATGYGYFNGSIDEVRIWNRTLSADEIKQHYYGSLNKYAPTKWLFTSTQQDIETGTDNYYLFAQDVNENASFGENRTAKFNQILFFSPSAANGTVAAQTNFPINATIQKMGQLGTLKVNWNGQDAVIANDSLVLAYNFDDVAAIGDSARQVTDVSRYGNNGTIYGNTKLLLHMDEADGSVAYDEGVNRNNATIFGNTRLVLHMDENSGSVAYDESGYKNNGTCYNMSGGNGVTNCNWVSAKSGTGISFDGVDDNVRIPATGVNTTAGAVNTVEFWVYWKGTEAQMPFGFASSAYTLYFAYGCLGFNTGNSDVLGVSNVGMKNRWVHVVAGFYNGVPSAVNNSIYIDGERQTLTQCAGTPISRTVSSGALLSGWGSSYLYKLNGSMDEVAIYSKALNATEVQAHYLAGKATHVDWTTGKSGTGLQFDGVDDYLMVNDYAALRPNTNDWSISLWFSAQAANQAAVLVGKRQPVSPYNFVQVAAGTVNTGGTYTPSKKISVWYRTDATSEVRLATVNDVLDGGWHQVVVIRFGDTHQVYVDGVLQSLTVVNKAGIGPYSINNSYPMYVGCSEPGAAHFNGSIDEVGIYNRSLNATEVLAHYNAGKAKHADWDQNGKWSGALNFDGVDDYVNIGIPSSLQMYGGAVTVALWVKPNSLPSDSSVQELFFAGATGGHRGYGMAIRRPSGKLFYEVYGSTGGRQYFESALGFVAGEWQYVVCVFDGVNNVLSAYRNGVMVHSVIIADPGYVDNSDNFALGSGYSTWFFNGSMDEVRVWNRSLSADEIKAQYYSNLNKYAPTKWMFSSYWNYSETSNGNINYYLFANDSAGNYNYSQTRTMLLRKNMISFLASTPADGAASPTSNVTINATIQNVTLNRMVFNWNGTNTTIYDNDSLVLAYNFDDIAGIGDSAAKVVDVSRYGNNGTIYGNTLLLMHMDEAISGTAYDESRLANNGTCYNMNGGSGVTNCSWAAGKSNSGILFDGVDDAIRLATNVTLPGPFTFATWFNKLSNGTYQTFAGVDAGFSCSGGCPKIIFYTSDDIFVRATEGGASTQFSVGYNAATMDNHWNFLVVTRDQYGVIRGSLNGGAFATGASLNGTMNFIRAGMGDSSQYFNGTLDEYAFYNRSISQTEATTLYGQGRARHADWDQNGTWGSAMKFDGIDDYVRYNVFRFNTSDAWSYSMWQYKPTSSGDSWEGFIGQTLGLISDNTYGYFMWHHGSLTLYKYAPNVTSFASLNLGTTVPYDRWFHLVVTCVPYNTSYVTLTAYLNGGAVSQSNTIPSDAFRFRYVGGSPEAVRYFNGSIDEVRIWNRSLSASEVRQQYYGSLNKYAPDKWLFTTVQQSQPSGTHNYTIFVDNGATVYNATQTRTVVVS